MRIILSLSVLTEHGTERQILNEISLRCCKKIADGHKLEKDRSDWKHEVTWKSDIAFSPVGFARREGGGWSESLDVPRITPQHCWIPSVWQKGKAGAQKPVLAKGASSSLPYSKLTNDPERYHLYFNLNKEESETSRF